MNPAKVVREKVRRFTDLPNIGPAMAKDFELLGFTQPQQLAGVDPLKLYESLRVATGSRHDPCVLDTFMSVTHFLGGGEPQPWWHFTEQRKHQYGHLELVSGKPSLSVNNSSKPTRRRGAV
ncbi:helix-hairpin-helix domain-containing protein [Lysobacter sp. HA35]